MSTPTRGAKRQRSTSRRPAQSTATPRPPSSRRASGSSLPPSSPPPAFPDTDEFSSDQDAVADVDDDAVDDEEGEDLYGDALLE